MTSSNNTSTRWFTSDQHFGHSKVIEYCNRPFKDLAQMHHTLIRRWNSVVKPQDTVYVLGDFAFLPIADLKPILDQLNGTKILILGNHDKHSKGQYLRVGFSLVLDQAILRLGKKRVKLSHYPYQKTFWQKLFNRSRYEDRYLELRPAREANMWLLHGHVHNTWKIKESDRMINVGVDQWNFAPISEQKIEEIINGNYKEIK